VFADPPRRPNQPLAHAELVIMVRAISVGRFLKIVLSAGGDVSKNHLFGHAAAKQDIDPRQQLGPRHEVAILGGKLLSITERGYAPRNDGNFETGSAPGISSATRAWPDS